MLVKLGVTLIDLDDRLRRFLTRIDEVFKAYGLEAVITSGTDGEHMPGSLHYKGRAIDLRLPPINYVAQVMKKLKDVLGKDFDVVLEKDHIHVEHDPKG